MTAQFTTTTDSADDATLRTIFGEKADFYLPRFRAYEKGQVISWSWLAFLFCPYWLAWRKAYLPAWLIFVLNLLLANTSLLVGLALWIAMGLLGLYAYFWDVSRRLVAVQQGRMTLEAASGAGANKHFLWMLGIVIAFFVLTFVGTALFGAAALR